MGNANTIYSAKRAAALTNPLTANVTFLQADNSAKAAAVFVPDQWQENTVAGSLALQLRCWGRVTSGTSGNVTVAVQAGTATSGNTTIFTSSAASYTANGNYYFSADLLWDVTSKLLNGMYYGWATTAGTAITPATITQLAAKDYSTNGLGFTAAGFFGTTNAGNILYLDGLTLEVI
jgi:hypothetical protein